MPLKDDGTWTTHEEYRKGLEKEEPKIEKTVWPEWQRGSLPTEQDSMIGVVMQYEGSKIWTRMWEDVELGSYWFDIKKYPEVTKCSKRYIDFIATPEEEEMGDIELDITPKAKKLLNQVAGEEPFQAALNALEPSKEKTKEEKIIKGTITNKIDTSTFEFGSRPRPDMVIIDDVLGKDFKLEPGNGDVEKVTIEDGCITDRITIHPDGTWTQEELDDDDDDYTKEQNIKDVIKAHTEDITWLLINDFMVRIYLDTENEIVKAVIANMNGDFVQDASFFAMKQFVKEQRKPKERELLCPLCNSNDCGIDEDDGYFFCNDCCQIKMTKEQVFELYEDLNPSGPIDLPWITDMEPEDREVYYTLRKISEGFVFMLDRFDERSIVSPKIRGWLKKDFFNVPNTVDTE